MVRDSKAGMLEDTSGKVVRAGGGEFALGGEVRVMAVVSWPADVLATSSSIRLVPDPCPGDRSCCGSD